MQITPKKLFFLSAGLLFASGIFAQVSDDFTDGDFTNNPTWAGDNADFIVNASHQLQLNSVSAVADTSYLSTASTAVANSEWDFWVKLGFAPSDNNYLRFYLVADVTNLKGPVNGYYIRMGENGSFDSVDLWEQTGNTSTKIIDGINSHCAASTNTLRIKVTRDATGNWTVYSDTLGGNNFNVEGTVFDNTHTTSSFFGPWCKYTISNETSFYLDDIYAGPIIVDTTPPSIVSASPTSATQLDVLFNENVDLTTSQTASNYSVNNGIGVATTAVRDASNHSLVHLTFGNSFVNMQSYVLTVINVQDLSANAITTATANFTYLPISAPLFRDVVINEIMADPSPVVALPNTEFIEIFNNSANNFNLSGWKFTDGTSTGTLSARTFGAGSYLILCANADTSLFSSYGPVMGLTTWPSLNNSGDHLKLMDPSSNNIDSVDYDISWYRDAVKQNGGWTLELINPNASANCGVGANWIASVNPAGGTPDAQNSVYSTAPDVTPPVPVSVTASDSMHVLVCFSEAISPAVLGNIANYSISPAIGNPVSLSYDSATMSCVTLTLGTALTSATTYTLTFTNLTDCSGNPLTPNTATFVFYIPQQYDVVINEIMADPTPQVALPAYEYVELHNTTAYAMRLDGWKFSAGTSTATLNGIILPADSFAILTSTSAASQYSGNVYGVTGFPALTNSGAMLTLLNQYGQIIHTVTYSDTWYNNAVKKNGGWSLEMIDANNPCAGSNNWTASNSPTGGTPGYRNSVAAANPDNSSPHLVRVSVITADSIRLFFSESLDSTTMLDVARYSIDNSVGNPLSVKPVSPDFSKCDLKLPVAISGGITYYVTVNTQLSDCSGNGMGNPNTAPFALPQPVSPNDIVINEILYDPISGGNDFVEIYNRSQKVIDLKTMFLCSQDTIANILTSVDNIAPEGNLLFPQQYLVLSISGEVVRQQYPSQTDINHCLDMPSIPSMNVSGGIVVLADTGSHIIDRLVYQSSWQFPLLQNTKGVSLERIDFDRPTQDPTNWHSASQMVGFATPTQKNSEYNPATSDDGAISLDDPIVSPDGDGYNDVLNINYHFDMPGYVANVMIYDARGRLVRTLVHNELLGTEQGTISWDGTMDDRTKARIGAYVIYFEAFRTDGATKRYKVPCVVAGKL